MVGISAIRIFDNNYKNNIPQRAYYRPAMTAPLKADTVSFGSKSIDIIKYNKLLRDIQNTADDAVCSIEDAVSEFAIFSMPKEAKAEYILACTYKGNKHEVTINKKALLTLKRKLFEIQNMPDIITGIKSSIDNKKKKFDAQKFKDYFDIRKRASVVHNSESKVAEFRYIENDKRDTIIRALEKETKQYGFENGDFFVPLEELRNSVIPDLYKTHMENGELPDELYFKMIDAISNNNFDLKSIYKNHYSKLAECKSLSEVEKLYPELKFQRKKPDYDKKSAQNSVSNMLSVSNYAYETLVLNVLKQGHLELVPENLIKVKLPNGQPKTLMSLKISGFGISAPSNDLIKVFDKCQKIIDKYSSIPAFDEKTMKDFASKEAISKSKYWADYKQMTDNEIWMPIRFIRNRKDCPNSAYSMDKLIDQYLAGLYLQGHGAYSHNPLSGFDYIGKLSMDMIRIIDNLYMPLYRNERNIDRVDKKGFADFVRYFDRSAIARSIKHLENVFNGNFMANYNSGERKLRYEEEYKKAIDLIKEKIEFQKQIEQAKIEASKPPKKEEWVQGDLFK